VAFSPDGRRIVSGSLDNTVKVWDAKTGGEIRTLAGHISYVSSVAFSTDERRIVSGSWDNTVKVWDAEIGQVLRTIAGHISTAYSAGFSHWRRMVMRSWDNNAKVCENKYVKEGSQLDAKPGQRSKR
jgi:WD40 repeat protein